MSFYSVQQFFSISCQQDTKDALPHNYTDWNESNYFFTVSFFFHDVCLISVPDIWVNYIKWGIMACDDVTKILVHSQVQALLSALGRPAVITKNSEYRTLNVCPWKKSTVNINSFKYKYKPYHNRYNLNLNKKWCIHIPEKVLAIQVSPQDPAEKWSDSRELLFPTTVWTQVS